MPEGTTLEETARVAQSLTRYIGTVPEVRDYTLSYALAEPPIALQDFNGLRSPLLYEGHTRGHSARIKP